MKTGSSSADYFLTPIEHVSLTEEKYLGSVMLSWTTGRLISAVEAVEVAVAHGTVRKALPEVAAEDTGTLAVIVNRN